MYLQQKGINLWEQLYQSLASRIACKQAYQEKKVRELEKDCKSTYQLKKKRFSPVARALYVSRKKGTGNNLLKRAYLIIRKSELKNDPLLVNDIVDGFKELYPYFD